MFFDGKFPSYTRLSHFYQPVATKGSDKFTRHQPRKIADTRRLRFVSLTVKPVRAREAGFRRAVIELAEGILNSA